MVDIPSSEKFIYESCLARVSDLNRNLFNYRLIYISIVASYFTSLSFVSNIARNASFFNFAEAYTLILLLITVAALFGVSVVLFFDFITQELVENALFPVEEIEKSNTSFDGRRMIYRPSSPYTSLYINTSIFIFYFISAFFLYAIVVFVVFQIHVKGFGTSLVENFREICFVQYLQNTDGLIVDKLYDPICMKDLGEFQFSEVFLDATFILLYLASFCACIFLLVAFHRVIGRLLNCAARGKYSTTACATSPDIFSVPVKKWFDVLMNSILILTLAIGAAAFVGLMSRGWFLQWLQAIVFPI